MLPVIKPFYSPPKWHRDPLCQILLFRFHLLELYPHQARTKQAFITMLPDSAIQILSIHSYIFGLAFIKFIYLHLYITYVALQMSLCYILPLRIATLSVVKHNFLVFNKVPCICVTLCFSFLLSR